MFQIIVKNQQNTQTYGGQFQLLSNANNWIAQQREKKSWGKTLGFYPLSQLSEAELAQELSRQTIDGLGNPLSEPLIEIPDQFTVEITDITQSYYMSLLREKRNQLLKDSDFSQLADAPLSTEQKSNWSVYRSELRDLPQNVVDVINPIWPVKPS